MSSISLPAELLGQCCSRVWNSKRRHVSLISALLEGKALRQGPSPVRRMPATSQKLLAPEWKLCGNSDLHSREIRPYSKRLTLKCSGANMAIPVKFQRLRDPDSQARCRVQGLVGEARWERAEAPCAGLLRCLKLACLTDNQRILAQSSLYASVSKLGTRLRQCFLAVVVSNKGTNRVPVGLDKTFAASEWPPRLWHE